MLESFTIEIILNQKIYCLKQISGKYNIYEMINWLINALKMIFWEINISYKIKALIIATIYFP